jgi:hypothetical protein
MRTVESPPTLSADGRVITFEIDVLGSTFTCLITRHALERYFWLEAEASEARVLKAFEDGRARITALATRKILARRRVPVLLKAEDFDLVGPP